MKMNTLEEHICNSLSLYAIAKYTGTLSSFPVQGRAFQCDHSDSLIYIHSLELVGIVTDMGLIPEKATN